MIGNFILYVILFIPRGVHSLTLLSCNSDAQANDNVNSDIKVSIEVMLSVEILR